MTVTGLLITAAEGPAHPNLWNPTILGVLVVLSAIGLFCGSVYLLLGTNLGGRLGFLVAFASLTGFMVLLSTLWWTSGNSGIDPPHGKSPAWKVAEVVTDPTQSKFPAVHDAIKKLTKQTSADTTALANLRPAMDAALVHTAPVANQEAAPQPFAKFEASLDYLTDFKGYQTAIIGGGTKNLFWHYPKYAVVQFCAAAKNTPAGAVPTCDPLQDKQYAILTYNFGSLREPVVFQFWVPSVLLFGLSLLGLHWYELDARARKRAATRPVPVPTPGA
jgi:hypothetical protein